MSIKKSLQSSILLMTVIPVILMAIIAYIVATSKYADITKENSKNSAHDYGYGFSTQLESQVVELKSLANSNDIKSFLLEKINSPDALLNNSSYYPYVQETLNQASNNFSNSVNYYIYDIDGYLTLASANDSISDWAEVMTVPITSFTNDKVNVISKSRFTDDTIDLIAPVYVKDQLTGIIRCNISESYFGAFLSDTGSTYVIDNEGNCLFGYNTSDDDDVLFVHFIQTLQKENMDSSDHELLNESYSNSRKYVYGYSELPEYHWIYVIKQDLTIYTKIMSTLPIIFLVLLLIVIILSSYISQSLAFKYTDPIFQLSADMKKAADGDLDVHCNIERDDEFGVLATNFNHMMDILSSNYNAVVSAQEQLKENQSELEISYQNIEKLAYTDGLTGLYNRIAFFKFTTEILSQTQSTIQNHAVIFIDLDGFKGINDTLGHDYGDLLLQCVANHLSSLISEDDILARNGGDEFVIFRNQIPSHEDLEQFLSDLIAIANKPFVLDDETVRITLSAGAALFPQNGLSLSELMKNADIAMYNSKNSGKNSYTFFNSTMEDEVNRRNDLIDILRDAIKNKDIYLLYQPQADISTGEIIGCEALMRLNSPIVGFVSPDEFIPVAEECGLIDELGEWALLEACQFNERIIAAGFKPIQISVNVSTTQLQGDRLIKAIESLPSKTTMPLEYLEIELTESVLMKNFDHNLAHINRMKELGIRISLDDFGTGYSSFSYLTQIPINTLKIDKSFIAGICDNTNDSYIAGTIINLAHQLGITVIAEGVETIEQLRILQTQHCDILQGYFFSRAIPESEFIEMLKINS